MAVVELIKYGVYILRCLCTRASRCQRRHVSLGVEKQITSRPGLRSISLKILRQMSNSIEASFCFHRNSNKVIATNFSRDTQLRCPGICTILLRHDAQTWIYLITANWIFLAKYELWWTSYQCNGAALFARHLISIKTASGRSHNWPELCCQVRWNPSNPCCFWALNGLVQNQSW